MCTKWMTSDSTIADLDDSMRETLMNYLSEKTKSGFRLLCMAYKDMGDSQEAYGKDPPETDLTLLGITAILDPLRPEVPHSVKICKGAGIKVVVVTGDHKATAKFIAASCGIYKEENKGVVMEATEFRA